MSEGCQEGVCIISGGCQENFIVFKVSVWCLKGVCMVSSRWLQGDLMVSGGSLECVSRMFGGCLGGVWKVSRRCPETV